MCIKAKKRGYSFRRCLEQVEAELKGMCVQKNNTKNS